MAIDMEFKNTKPMLNIEEQIQHLKNKGVSFSICSESDAYKYLQYNNFYFKLVSYRKNYNKYQDGKNKGRYIDLDFGYLKDLAIIDMRLRYMIVLLALDIEHHVKINLLTMIREHNEDGYTICKDFINSLSPSQCGLLTHEIERNKQSIYCSDLFAKYQNHFPVWVFLEIVPFGRMVSFYKFCAERFDSKEMRDMHFLLKTCKEIRNAATHNSCILNDLNLGNNTTYRPRYSVMQEIAKIGTISRNTRSKKLSNARIQAGCNTLLYK